MLPARGDPGDPDPDPWLIVDRGRILRLELAGDGLAVWREDVRLPVIERQLNGGADLPLRLGDVSDVGQDAP